MTTLTLIIIIAALALGVAVTVRLYRGRPSLLDARQHWGGV